MEKRDIYQMVTDRIIQKMEQGLIPWKKPWGGLQSGAYNRISKKPYSILNQMILQHTGEYATYKQWNELGGKVKRGEKAEVIVFWKIIEINDMETEEEEKKKNVPFLKYSSVFHISQVEGVEPLEKSSEKVISIENVDDIVETYVRRENIDFQARASNQAYYNLISDSVVVPVKEQYQHINEYYSTVFHELIHSTGHKTRLNRDVKASFGSEKYSKEELVAEIGTATVLNFLNIETELTFQNNVAYIQSWIKKMKEDNKVIIWAASQAEKAVNYIMNTCELIRYY